MMGVRRGGGGGRTRGEQTTRLEEADLGIKESRVERSLSAVQQAVKKANSPNANTYIWKDMYMCMCMQKVMVRRVTFVKGA